jgi:hypothetical protein
MNNNLGKPELLWKMGRKSIYRWNYRAPYRNAGMLDLPPEIELS